MDIFITGARVVCVDLVGSCIDRDALGISGKRKNRWLGSRRGDLERLSGLSHSTLKVFLCPQSTVQPPARGELSKSLRTE